MIMEIAHTGRTGKETTITFDTDTKTFCYNREKHDVFIYAERTGDVEGVVFDLKRIGYKEVDIATFREEAYV